MSSLPSKLIYVVDVPEIDDLKADFIYNFFVSDESVEEISGIPKNVLETPTSSGNVSFLNTIKFKTPRYVLFQWSNKTPATTLSTDTKQNTGRLISDNINKIISESDFATLNYASVLFASPDIDTSSNLLVSGSFNLQTLDKVVNQEASPQMIGRQLSDILFKKTSNDDFVLASLSNALTNGINSSTQTNGYFDLLKSVGTHVQISSKLLSDIVRQSAFNPFNQHNNALAELQKTAEQLQQHLVDISILPTDEEFKTLVPSIETQSKVTTQTTDLRSAEIVGYIIEKHEIDAGGNTIQHDPIIIETANVTTAYDVRIKYNSTYVYSIKTIALYKLAATDKDTLVQGTIKILVSSKPSTTLLVKCVETIVPPPPADISFIWNYETEKLNINWAFPSNSQRDIKKFQVFRRKTTSVPFELLRLYDFDDSAVKYQTEQQPENLTQSDLTPVLSYIDDDFTKNSRYIYTLCSIDAHGMTSNYGVQFEVWFDVFKNRLRKALVSHSGAPKPYPNLYIQADAFVDTVKVSGNNAKRMKLYFNPLCYKVKNDAGSIIDIVSTKQKGGQYKISLFNLDNQTPQTVDVTIDDRSTPTNVVTVSYPKSIYGAQRSKI